MSRKKSGFFVFQPFVSQPMPIFAASLNQTCQWVYGDPNAHVDRAAQRATRATGPVELGVRHDRLHQTALVVASRSRERGRTR
jgi:hypothetical protein